MLDLDKPITTRNGYPVRIICRDSKTNGGPLAVLIEEAPGREILRSYALHGQRYSNPHMDSSSDLINERVKVKRWKLTIDPSQYACPSNPAVVRGYFLYRRSQDIIENHTVPGNDGFGKYVKKIECVDVYKDELRDDE